MFFVVGGVWFWALIISSCFLIFLLTEAWDSPVTAFIAAGCTLGILSWFGNVEIIPWLRDNPVSFMVGCASYMAVGLFWSFARWALFLRKKTRKYFAEKADYLSQTYPPDLHSDQHALADWLKFSKRYSFHIPKARNHQSAIISSMVYWPFSMLWSAFSDVFYELFVKIFDIFKLSYQRVSNEMYKGVERDQELAEEAAAYILKKAEKKAEEDIMNRSGTLEVRGTLLDE